MADGAVDLETALIAARGLARLVVEEYPEQSLALISRSWTPQGMTKEEVAAIERLENAGGFAGVGE
jgi:hypothetical protein